MRRRIIITALALASSLVASAKLDTLKLSMDYTTHVIFSTDITYADLSNSKVITAKIIEQNKNMLAMKAREPFEGSTSISALESNGTMHTFIVVYQANPRELVIDMRTEKKQVQEPPKYQSPTAEMIESAKEGKGGKAAAATAAAATAGVSASTWKSGSAPLLQEVVKYPQKLYHVGCKEYDIEILCEDISAYSDITYMTLSVRNKSGISYEIGDATFVIESKRHTKRTIEYDKTIFPRSRYGSLNAGPGEYSRIVYSFDKMTLSNDQVLKVYMYESGGQRNLVMTIDTKDINKCRKTI